MLGGTATRARGPLVVGVPTWCEAASIERQIRQVDAALGAWGPGCEAVLVNADNASPDGTAAAFLATPTMHRKVVLTTERGKGNAEAALFRYALGVDAPALVTLDADLEVVPADWLPALTGPVLDGAIDIAIPLYARFWYDGIFTNQIVAPMVLAVTGEPIRQPTGGEFALGPAALRALLAESWPPAATGFASDLHMVITGLRLGLRHRQVPLSYGKVHSWRSGLPAPELAAKFAEMALGTLAALATFPAPTGRRLPPFPAAPPPATGPKPYDLTPTIQDAARDWQRHGRSPLTSLLLGAPVDAYSGPPDLDDAAWAAVLVRALRVMRQEPPDGFAAVLQTLQYQRLVRELPRYREMSCIEVDRAVHALAVAIRDNLVG
jgi:hypothetical protein